MMDLVRQKPWWRVGSWDSLTTAVMEMSTTHGMSKQFIMHTVIKMTKALCDVAAFRALLTGSSHWLHAHYVYTRWSCTIHISLMLVAIYRL